MTRYRIISWRDIPVQVKVKSGHFRLSRPLSPRFQKTVHRAAYRAKVITGDEYLEEWHISGWQEHQEPPEGVIAAVIAELEAAYDDARLEKMALNKGFESHDH